MLALAAATICGGAPELPVAYRGVSGEDTLF